ncbi:BRO-N domain-containing protein [[Pasteurella] aerogenes]|nr:Bro-N domain-containing protein [[Pasteurella] aerogenes]
MSQSTQLSTFNFEKSSIRVIAVNNEPWFVAKDVCDAIGIDNNRKALLALDEDEKGVTLSNTLGGQQEMNIISESGMYTLILRCRDAVKKGSVPHRFRKWVTSEVLPQIRKTGQYTQILPLEEIKADEEALHIIVNLFHSLNGAYEMGEKIRKEHPYLAKEIDKTIGGHYLYNLNGPTENALTKARKYVHAKSERIMFVKGMLSLLEEPKRIANF